MSVNLKVGDRIWCHDGRSHREPWFEGIITGETRVSWLVGGRPYKVNKKTMLENMGDYGDRRWHTVDSMNAYRWLQLHPHKIADLVRACKDISTLLRVATLVGYIVEAPSSEVIATDGGTK